MMPASIKPEFILDERIIENETYYTLVMYQPSEKKLCTEITTREIGRVFMNTNSDSFTISGIHVNEIYRKRGYGKALLEEALYIAAEIGNKKITFNKIIMDMFNIRGNDILYGLSKAVISFFDEKYPGQDIRCQPYEYMPRTLHLKIL